MTKDVSTVTFNEDEVALIKSQIAPKASDAELKLFLYQAKRTGLDPLTRQIYAIFRNVKEKRYGKDVWIQKMTIQTSIDGFRVIAERSGDYAGQDEPIFVEENGGLICCKVAVYRFRGNVRYAAAVGVAYWSEYAQLDDNNAPTGLWKKMPHTMLAKVAEALALRKAYPQDLSGLYTGDEMAQAEEVKVEEMKTVTPKEGSVKNSFGLSADGSLANGEDMKETLNKKNEEDFRGLKSMIENCGGEEELKQLWLNKENAKIINSLKKWREDLYNLLVQAKDEMKASFIQDAIEGK